MVIKLIGIRTSKKQQAIIFNKSESLVGLLEELLSEIGAVYLESLYQYKGNIKNIKDQIETFEESGFHVSIIFGENRVFFVGSYGPSKRKKVLEIIRKKCVFKDKKSL